MQIQAPLRKWKNDGELETVGIVKVQTSTVDAKNLSTPDLSSTPIYRGYATMSETDANDLDETVAGTAMDYIKGFDAGYHFTSSRSEAHDYATGRTDKSEETFMNDEGQVITQQNRHYRGDYAHVSAYTIDPSAKVVYFDDVLEANAHPELMRDADVIVLKQGTLGSTNTEYIVRKGAKHLVHKIESRNEGNSENFTTQPIIENNKKPKSEPSLSINLEQKSSSETKAQLKELISSINSPYLKEVTDADLEGVDDFTADAEGFVKDGVIYINTDRASVGTVIHELGHLYLGALKSDPEKRERYYDILANMHEYCDLWHEMQGNQFYANKRGSDFDEEIAARLIEMYYNGSIMSERDKALAQELIMISGISLENLPKPEKMQWMSENYKIKQSVATLKNKLYEDEVIKDIDC